MSKVMIEDAPRMNLLGLIVGAIIKRNAETKKGQKLLENISGDLVVQAGQMQVTLKFDRGNLTITRGGQEKYKAFVRGTMDAFIGLALGKGVVRPFVTGQIKVKGNMFFLLKVKPLLLA